MRDKMNITSEIILCSIKLLVSINIYKLQMILLVVCSTFSWLVLARMFFHYRINKNITLRK